eukprot:GEZU01035748.1.p1 GENE.GEZU01035748.1~~GEZU01035748.1.p1  ORF type:complete len:544 (-),score=111.29 GEZU01035748.1:87-1718(-)
MHRLFVFILLVAAQVIFATAQNSPQGSCPFSLQDCEELQQIRFDGQLFLYDGVNPPTGVINIAAQDYGGYINKVPGAVLQPASYSDIQKIVRFAFYSQDKIQIAARGQGHSTNGQSQVEGGIVIDMSTLNSVRMPRNPRGSRLYVDADGGATWLQVLQTTLAASDSTLAPPSFTDLLSLSVGGTLSNAGIGGLAFQNGPQTANVLEVEVVTGTGQRLICSPTRNSHLYRSVFGGLGQFGIIVRARIALEQVPPRAFTIHALYDDFATFSMDMEMLISNTKRPRFDYVEGFQVHNDPASLREVPFAGQSINSSLIPSPETHEYLFYIEVSKFYDPEEIRQPLAADALLHGLHYIRGLAYAQNTTYFDFINRLGFLAALPGQNDENPDLQLSPTPHPWINLFLPSENITTFYNEVLASLDIRQVNGPIIVYPMNKDTFLPRFRRTTLLTPFVVLPPLTRSKFFVVSLLRTAVPATEENVQQLQQDNERIYAVAKSLGGKAYLNTLDHTQEEWMEHFGDIWPAFAYAKEVYDPLHLLSPGQLIFAD